MEEGDDIFTDQSDFGGSLLRVTAVPYAHHVQARAIPPDREDWGEGNQYEAHYGYEIEMMEEARKVLNFEYAVTNPPDQGWGIIQEDYRDEQKKTQNYEDVIQGSHHDTDENCHPCHCAMRVYPVGVL